MKALRKAVFLDRDGVLNIDKGYLVAPKDFVFPDGVFEAVARLKEAGWLVIVITNQSGVARGYYTWEDYLACEDWFERTFASRGAAIDASYACPHHPKYGAGPYLKDCDCRKPSPGMIFQAVKDFGIDLSESAIVGDKESDVEAGFRAGIPVRIRIAKDWKGAPEETPFAGAYASSLTEAVDMILEPQLRQPDFEAKIVKRKDLARLAAALPRPVVMTNGVFDILHRGHASYLARAKSLGKSLIAAVNSDASVRLLGKGPERPINTEADRAALIASLCMTDLVVVFDEKVPLSVISEARPDIYVKGADYRNKPLPEADLVRSWGGRVELINFEFDRSTTKTLKKIRNAS